MWLITENTIRVLYNKAYNQGYADAIAKIKGRDVNKEADDWRKRNLENKDD